MELDGRISNKLLVGGIFAVLIFSLVGSQQPMAGANGTPPDIDIDKCATTDGFGLPVQCNVAEGSASSILIEANEEQVVFFRIDANANPSFPDVTGVVVNDLLPDGFIFVSSGGDGTYDPATGVWDIGTISEGGTRSLLITTIVDIRTCGTTLVNTATLTAVDQTENTPDNNQDSVSVDVVPASGDCPPIVTSPGNMFVVMGASFNDLLDDGSLATANLDTGELTQVGPEIASQVSKSGLSGLAINSFGQFFVTAVTEGSSSRLLEVDGNSGEIINEIGNTPNVKIRDLAFQPGTDILFGVGRVIEGSGNNILFTIDREDAEVNVITSLVGDKVKGIAFDPNDGKLYAVNSDCALTTLDPTGGSGVQTLVTQTDRCYDGLGIDAASQIFATTEGDSLHLIDPSDGSDVTVAGIGENPSDVDFTPIGGGGGSGAVGQAGAPTIGVDGDGRQIVPCGVAFDGQCFTISAPFHEEFELFEMMSGTHTISITMWCPKGVSDCAYSAIGVMPYSASMDNPTWKIEVYKDFEGNTVVVKTDPEGFLGEVTVSDRIEGIFWVTSFTIEFKNIDTDPMMFGVQARTQNGNVWNWYLNEGVQFKDSDAYPSIDSVYNDLLEIDSLCLNEDPTYRYSCAFENLRERAIQIAEETLRLIMNK